MSHSRLRIGFYYGVVAIVGIVLSLQYTKQAMLPRTQTNLLWAAAIATAVGVLILRSGWGRDSGWREEQARLGTLVNNFYEPRREALSNGFAIGCGVLLSLWWALATWSAVIGGFRHNSTSRGLADFEVGAVVGALTGGIVGAVIGLALGHVWETRHRRSRLERKSAHA